MKPTDEMFIDSRNTGASWVLSAYGVMLDLKQLQTKLLRLYYPLDLPWRMKKTAEAFTNLFTWMK